MKDQQQPPWDGIEAAMHDELLGNKTAIPLLGDCPRHQGELWRHAPCPMCERDATIARLQAERDRSVLTAMERNTEIHNLQTVLDAGRERCLDIITDVDGYENDDAYGFRVAAQEILSVLVGEVKPCPTCHGKVKS
jgi:hypothetical protein